MQPLPVPIAGRAGPRSSCAAAWALLAGLLLLLLPGGGGARAQEGGPIPIALAVQELRAGPAAEPPMGDFESVAAALERASRVRIVTRAPLRGDWLANDSEPRRRLEARALSEGARYLLLVSVTRVGGLESWDVEIRPVSGGPSFAHQTAQSAEELGERAREAVVRLATEHASVHAQAEGPVQVPGPSPAPGGEVAGSEPVPGVEVAEIRIEGNRRIDEAAIRAVLGTRVGEALSPGGIARDIRRIMELQFFSNAEVYGAPLRTGQLIVFRVYENPIIRRVTITGNDNLKSEDITENLTLTIGSTIDYPQVIENEQRIEGLYQTKGYYQADASYTVEELETGAVSVDYEVAEGKELRLRKVHFEGNDALDDGDLLRGLETRPWRWYSLISSFWDHSGLYAEPIFYQDLDTLQNRYMDQGYIRVEIDEPVVEIDDEGIEVTVKIQEGPKFHVGVVDVLGDDTLAREKLQRLVILSPGVVFGRSLLSDDVERLRRYYSDRGFYSANVRPRTDVDPDALTVDVIFEVDKKELFFVDWIDVAGNTRTRDKVVRREVSLGEGELFSDGAVQRSKARVKRLGFFEEVEVETTQVDDRNVGVTIDVVERPTGSFSFGAGVGSYDGLLLNASVRQDNLFGRGWSVNASIDAGSRNSYGTVRFSDPYFLQSVAGFGISLSFTDREFLDFDQQIRGIALDVSYPLDEGETRGGIGYGFSSREVTGFTGFQAASLLQREEFQGDTTTSLVTFSLRQDTRDDIRFPRRGHRSGAALEFAGLGGLSQFLRLEAYTTRYIPWRRWLPFDATFVLNSRVGWVVPFNSLTDFDLPSCSPGFSAGCDNLAVSTQIEQLANIDDELELPLSERYFLGGVGTYQLRGYEQRSLGPRRAILVPFAFDRREFVFAPQGFDSRPTLPNPVDPMLPPIPNPDFGICVAPPCNDINETDAESFADLGRTDLIGGNKMFLLNLELRFPLSEELGLEGIVFFDMGNAFAENDSMDIGDFRYSTGIGAQWFSPFGPILVFFGLPLNALEDEDTSAFEFSMGGSQF